MKIASLGGQIDFEAQWAAAVPLLRRSARARRLSLRVHRDARVEIVAPPHLSARVIERFVVEHRDWIDRHVNRARASAPPVAEFPPRAFELSAWAESWSLSFEPGQSALRLRTAQPGVLQMTGTGTHAAIARTLRHWLLAYAGPKLVQDLRICAAQLGVRFGACSIRRQRSRWGSCSAKGRISLNIALAFQPPAVVQYLLVHELTHLKHMNHSNRFWQEVARHCPDWRRLDRELLAGWCRVPKWLHHDEA
jgi:hypothetical protein